MNWYYDEPFDESAKFARRVVYSREMILREYREEWLSQVYRGDPQYVELLSADSIDEHVIEDWIIVNSAVPTDMPPGEYVTRTRGAL